MSTSIYEFTRNPRDLPDSWVFIIEHPQAEWAMRDSYIECLRVRTLDHIEIKLNGTVISKRPSKKMFRRIVL